MEKFVKGDVIVLSFPFSDLSSSKKRPALVLSNIVDNDLILCQITSQQRFDKSSIPLEDSDFKKGKLSLISNIRPNKLFTADKEIIDYKIGSLNEKKLKEVIDIIIKILRE